MASNSSRRIKPPFSHISTNSVDKNLTTIIKNNRKTDKYLLESLLQDLAFIIGKLSSIYEILLKTIPNKIDNKN